MTKTIIVPLDGSELSEQVLPCVAAIATKSGAEVVLLSAVVPVESWMAAEGVYPPGKPWEDEAKAASDYLSAVRDRLQDQGIAARPIVTWGKAAECIRQAAAASDMTLIAMTTHGRSGLPRLVLGSVASEIMRTSSHPVLLVKAAEHPPAYGDLSRILVPVDGSPMSEEVLATVEELARDAGSEIVLLRVVTPPVILYPGEAVPSTQPMLEDVEAAARNYVEQLASTVKHKGFAVQHEVVTGEASEAIVEAATRYGAGLIALSSHGRTGLARLLIGSTADNVVRQSATPVLIIRPRAVVDTQLRELAPVGIEIIEGVSVAPTLVPPPEITEVPVAQQTRNPYATPAREHRPERRSLS